MLPPAEIKIKLVDLIKLTFRRPEQLPQDPLSLHIRTLSGGITPLEKILRQIAAENGVKTPGDLDNHLPSLEGIELGLGGKPEALFRKLGGTA